MNTILFSAEACPLALEDKRNAFRARMNFATHQLGCWHPTLDDGFVFVGSLPELTHISQVVWEAFPRALLHTDGSATIIEPDYDSETFLATVTNKKWMERLSSHKNERP
jgi:hypothetical protein